jgi:hypothetical protein
MTPVFRRLRQAQSARGIGLDMAHGSGSGVYSVSSPGSIFPLSVLYGHSTERNLEVTHFYRGGHEIVSHGYRWIDYHHIDAK